MTYQALTQRIAARSRESGRAVAVVEGGRELSYRGLDAHSARLAARLRALGLGTEDVAGILIPRSLELVVGLLAIWRAGAAYVPLDPEHPQDRISWLLQDTEAKAIVTTRALAEQVSWFSGTVVAVDDIDETDETDDVDEAGLRAGGASDPAQIFDSPDAAAYVLYTSGSTGRPKGVVVTRGGIANYVDWKIRTHAFGPGDRILQRTSLMFDAAGWELFAPLASGATLVLAPVGAERDPAAVLRTVAAHQVTVMQVVPSVLRLLTGRPEWAAGTGSLRLLLSGGEALHSEMLDSVKAEVWNTYGPTECTIDVAAHRFDAALDEGPVPIGRAVDGNVLYVLDAAGRSAPIGVPGELHVGGLGLARGYVGRPDLTAQRFVPAPFGPDGARLYRTGDRVRWNEDGELEYLGRLDRQVKVGGVRIEPGEIEAVAGGHPGVEVAVVDVYPGPDGTPRLTAHYTGSAQPAELRAFLADKLPRSHVPAVLLPVAEFPLLTSGKLDRTTLAALALSAVPRAADAGSAQLSESEKLVAAAWHELIGTSELSAEDDFFQLGGHSLLVPRLADLLLAASGRRLEYRDLYTATTIAGQAALVARRSADEPERETEIPVLSRQQRSRDLPTTPGQRRLWFLDRVAPGNRDYHVPVVIRLAARVSPTELRQALARLAERHEILRTRYPGVDGRPVQRIEPVAAVSFSIAESADPAEEVRRQLSLPFDLVHGPVWRAGLVPADGTDPGSGGTLVLCLHHIACDGWSVAVLERDLQALLRGETLAGPALQYADFAAWTAARLDEAGARQDLDHWRGTLEGIAPLDLPTDHPRPAVRDSAGAMVTFRLSAATAQALEHGVARPHAATLSMTALTAFATLLARFGGGWDVPVGVPVTGRDRPQTRDTVGFFLNTLVMRCRLDPQERFAAALERTRATVLAGFAHQDTPFEQVVEMLEPERDLSRTPLYQVMFDLQEEGVTAPSADRAAAGALTGEWRTAKTDLTMVLRRGGDGSVFGVLEYATSLFEEATARRLCESYVRLIEQLAADPDRRLRDYDLMGPQERAAVLAAGRGSVVERLGTCLDLFDRCVEQYPQHVAVLAVDEAGHAREQSCYAELSARADRIAALLRARGVGREDVVGVLLERGVDLLACLLGIWRAGAAYLPLDPGQPAARLEHVLADSRATAVVCAAGYRDLLAECFRGTVIDAAEQAANQDGATTAEAVPAAGDLAYVLYTSGSSGRPKGVRVEHGALANTLLSLQATLACGPGDRWLAQTTTTFDIAAVETILPLTCGAGVVITPAATAQDGDALVAVLAEHGVTHVQATPSGWRLMLHAGLPAQTAARIRGLTGGEAVPAELARELSERLRGLVVGYGPTEAAVIATVWPVPRGADPRGRALIGRSIENTVAYVLDDEGEPVPPGVVGELCLAGAGLARGYQDPAATARSFRPNPFGPPGSRLYRTGDLARTVTDGGEGSMEFRGRVDSQFKINGYRVEAGEIEAVLGAHPGVRTAVVALRPADGDRARPRLLAYYVPAGAAVPTGQTEAAAEEFGEQLAALCRSRLPEYMVPTAFTRIDAVPVTAHGKIDYGALPEPARRGGPATSERGPVAQGVARLWQRLLGEDPGDQAAFFASGGDSLLAVQLAEEIATEYGIEFPAREVFRHPLIPAMAARVEQLVEEQIAALPEEELLALAAELGAAVPTRQDSSHTPPPDANKETEAEL